MICCGCMDEGLPAESRTADIMVCATGHADLRVWGLDEERVRRLSATTQIPITLDYETPDTLGSDRIAAACGAWIIGRTGCPKLIIDAGTCITIDYLDAAGVYHGGAILPGIGMKFRALHTFTAKLPLLEHVGLDEKPIAGRSTRDSLVAGVLTATRYEVEGFVNHYCHLNADTEVLLTGGDCGCLQDSRADAASFTVEPHLVMIGLNGIMNYGHRLI